MKLETLHCCLFLPISLLAELCTDTTISYKFVCKGDTVEVFHNITSISLNKDIVFYKQFGIKHDTMAMWHMQNSSYTVTILDKYRQKVSLENDNILLKDFKTADEATYGVQIESTTKVIQLCELIPPTTNCNLDIKQEENVLIASLNNPKYCGKPLVSVRWMDSPYISYRSPGVIEVPSGNQIGPYRACIEGKALSCVTDSQKSDYCKNFTTFTRRESGITYNFADNSTNASTVMDIQLKNTTDAIFWIVLWVLVLVFAFGCYLIFISFDKLRNKCRRQKNSTRNDPEREPEVRNPLFPL